MAKVSIVTDSSAQFLDPAFVSQHDITVIPATIRLGEQTFREGVDLDAEGFFRRILAEGAPAPVLEAPTVAEYVELFGRLGEQADHILVLPMASGLSQSYRNALAAAEIMRGRSDIVVIDSLTASVGLAFLVEIAVRAVEDNAPLESVVRTVRAAVPRVYSVFYVETLEYLFRGNLIGEAQAILGKILGIKPFLTIEDGCLVPMEKVRTRAQAVDKLLEFVTEFADIQRLVIVQNTTQITEQTRLIQDRLALEFGEQDFPVIVYGPSLAAHLGPDGIGIVVCEAEEEA